MRKVIAIIGLALLGIAFIAVSLWVTMSGGHSARAVRTKFRIGGAMLSLTALLSLTACEGEGIIVSCYDPAPPPSNGHFWSQDVADSELRNGDVVVLCYHCSFGKEMTISLISDDDNEDRVLCSQTYAVEEGDNQLEFTIEAGEYRGRAQLCAEYVCYEGDSVTTFGGIFVSIID